MQEPLKVGDRVRVVGYSAPYWPSVGEVEEVTDDGLPLPIVVCFEDEGTTYFAEHELEKVDA